jgi:hypothetical protein
MPVNVQLIERNQLKEILLKAVTQELLITVDGHLLKGSVSQKLVNSQVIPVGII